MNAFVPIMKSTKAKLSLSLVWLLLIWTLSSLPSNDLPGLKILSIDKVAHLGIYLILGLLVNGVLKSIKAGRITISLVYAILLLNAALDETHQQFIPGRSVSIYDLMANSLGLVLAYLWMLRQARGYLPHKEASK